MHETHEARPGINGSAPGCCFALLFMSIALTPACVRPGHGDGRADQPTGSMSIALRAEANGLTYRLRDAVFDVTGPEQATLRTDDPDARLIERPLRAGSYEVRLTDGWRLERSSSAGFQGVVALLSSDNPRSFTIEQGRTSGLVFQFRIPGTGLLSLSIEVLDETLADAGAESDTAPGLDAGGPDTVIPATDGPGSVTRTTPLSVVDTSPTAAQSERLSCIQVHVDGPRGLADGIRRIRITPVAGVLSTSLYRTAANGSTGPVNCPARFATDPELIAFQQGVALDLSLPDGIGVPLGNTSGLLVRLHAFNASDMPVVASAMVTLDTVDDPSLTSAGVLALLAPVSIPPHSTGSASAMVNLDAPSTIVALGVVERRLGVASRVTGGMGNTYFESTAGPNFTMVSGPPLGGTFRVECQYDNVTNSVVTSGDGFLDEECSMLAYYVPSRGFRLCFGGTC